MKVIANCGDGHQTPPEGLNEGPGVAGMVGQLVPGDVVLGLPLGAVQVCHVPGLLLSKVHQAGVGQDGNTTNINIY